MSRIEMWRTEMARPAVILGLAVVIPVFTGCRQDMHDQPRYEPLEQSQFFRDGQSARQLVRGTVPRGYLKSDQAFFTGRIGDQYVTEFPFPITKESLERGRERFNIYCSPCHGQTGFGNGMIVQRGFSPPPSYHQQRLREEPIGHFFDVVTNGFGAMASYAARVEPRDRWNIIAYIRALQLSQQATKADVPPEEADKITEGVQ
ncbi:MAG: c-type cytochrome [Bryobacteraceae bacterium]